MCDPYIRKKIKKKRIFSKRLTRKDISKILLNRIFEILSYKINQIADILIRTKVDHGQISESPGTSPINPGLYRFIGFR